MVKIKFPKLFREKQSKYLTKTGRPKTIIATGQKSEGGKGGDTTRTEKRLKTFWDYYQGEGIIFASISITAWNTVMVGYHLISDDPKAKEIVQKAFDATDIDGTILDNVIYALVFGDSFVEKIKGKTEGKETINYYDLHTVDPITMIANTDEYGRITGYQQKIGGKVLPSKLKPEQIIHFKFFPKPSTPYGVSLLEPSIDTIDRKITTDESLANAIQRHGTTKYVVQVGNDEEIPPESVFTAIKTKLEDIDSQNEFIIPKLVDIKTIDEKGIQGVKEYSDYFMVQLIVGLLCPEEALGQGKGSTEATSKVKEIMYERFIKSIQHKIAINLKKELIDSILEENGMEPGLVKMRFNSVTDSDEAVKAKWMGNLLRGFPEGKMPFTINEVRAVFDYPAIEGGDELLQQESGSEGEEKPEKDEKEGKKTKNDEKTPKNDEKEQKMTKNSKKSPKNTKKSLKIIENHNYKKLLSRIQDLEDELNNVKEKSELNEK